MGQKAKVARDESEPICMGLSLGRMAAEGRAFLGSRCSGNHEANTCRQCSAVQCRRGRTGARVCWLRVAGRAVEA